MSMTQLQTATDSFKEVINRPSQPGLEAVYIQAPGVRPRHIRSNPIIPFIHRYNHDTFSYNFLQHKQQQQRLRIQPNLQNNNHQNIYTNPVSQIVCPTANNTLVTQPLGSLRYRIHCDSDFATSGKQTLSSVVLASFNECLSLCNTMNYFQDRTDIGCTYNVAGAGTQTPGTCWCLAGEGLTVVENVGNEVAVPV
ncbi:hypothetical protein BJY04DRAFT_220835 [Aspergillus karnatakaensis]|uniref:uncharacterized protein n=1 Tax=Aspergillus karnatakaensis TaxID=1810916 RepID=UPI003CCCF38D